MDWHQTLRTHLDVPTGGADLIVQLVAADLCLTFDGGGLRRLDRTSDHAIPDLVIWNDPADVIARLTCDLDAEPDGLVLAAPGETPAAPYPFDFPQPPGVEPSSPGDLRVQMYVSDTPFGSIRFWDTIRAGQLVARHPGKVADPHAVVKRHYADVIGGLTSTDSLLDILTGARVSARHPGVLVTLAGSYDAPGLRDRLNWRPRTNLALLRLASHTQHPAWQKPAP